ncbi:MAG TPA: FAD:protein FMN transferase [Candidatus Paceibacterota bacterium]|nr:FAD:protein FMN transferase [Candidatus Paceibacterota bacterium]
MKQTEIIMGMPITIEIADHDTQKSLSESFDYFRKIDNRFSTYKPKSEISQINRGLPEEKWSHEMQTVMKLCEETKQQSNGYFDISHNGKLDPSGLVKGWAIAGAAKNLRLRGFKNFSIEAGGDIQTNGGSASGKPWRIGIRNPFHIDKIIKVIELSGGAVATSGTSIRGAHIYNPHQPDRQILEIKSLTVVGENIYDADRFATAAFAMGKNGIHFIESLPGFEGYQVDANGIATFTTHFEKYVSF